MMVFWGCRLLAIFRRIIPDMETPALEEPLRIHAHLATIGFFSSDDTLEALDSFEEIPEIPSPSPVVGVLRLGSYRAVFT